MGSLTLITDHSAMPDSGACRFQYVDRTCDRASREHLFNSDGSMNPHAWLGPADESGQFKNTRCRVDKCGRLRLAKMHASFGPEYLPEEPKTQAVGGMRLEQEGKMQDFFLPMAKPVHAVDLIPAVQAWDAFSAQVRDTIVRKSQGYGDAWRRQGYMGNLARVLSKSARLDNMLWCDVDQGMTDGPDTQESVTETLVDLGAMAAFTVANLEEGNRWGR